ncbi:MAG: hypothetical protein LBS76_05120 [Mycoplasmataceae bacterium]|jgi:hypothetical protein|nr:hypothetical protein [Mycoplasmataceae bacterium]
MPKFNVNATMNTISTLSVVVDANDLNEATIIALQNAKKQDWKLKRELKTNTK